MIDENKLIMQFADMQLQLAPERSSKDKIAWDTLEGAIEAVKEQPKIGGWIGYDRCITDMLRED